MIPRRFTGPGLASPKQTQEFALNAAKGSAYTFILFRSKGATNASQLSKWFAPDNDIGFQHRASLRSQGFTR